MVNSIYQCIEILGTRYQVIAVAYIKQAHTTVCFLSKQLTTDKTVTVYVDQ